MDIVNGDLSTYLYERLSTNKYGNWVNTFGRDNLRILCEYFVSEIQPAVDEEIGELLRSLDEIDTDHEILQTRCDHLAMKIADMELALYKIGLTWDDENKKFIIDAASPIRQLKF